MCADTEFVLIEAAECEVDIEQTAIAGYASVLLHAYKLLLPSHQRIEDVHVLAVAGRLAIIGLAELMHPRRCPHGMYLAAHHIDEARRCRERHLVHLLVGHVGGQIAIDGATDEVDVDRRIISCMSLREISDVGQSRPRTFVVDDVSSVLQMVGEYFRLATIEVIARLSSIPRHHFQVGRLSVGKIAHHNQVLPRLHDDSRHALQLVIELVGCAPFL